MSGIFGFINLDGRPASPEHFQKMADEMAGWGPDGVGSVVSNNAAIGHALLVVTHESRFEKMPVHDQDEGILFTAAARLDNRDELCDLFGIPHLERPVTSDGQLVLKTYKKWGSESCKHIFGDWSFVAWHIKEQRLFLARDHLGNTGVYYYFKPPLLVFASSVKTVLAHPEVPCDLNELHLARRMIFDYSEETFFQTYWVDVCFLPASHNVNITGTGKQIEKYWRLDEAPAIRFKSDNEYLEGFLDQFRRAVRVRLNSIRPVGSTLSAGLDSSSVTALAAEELQKRNQPLVAYTSVPLYLSEKLFPGSLINEWPLAHLVAECYDNIKHIQINAEDIPPMAAVKQSLKILHTPQHAAINMFWILSIFENAQRCKLGVMLTGQLGNGSVSWSGGRDYIFYLFLRKRWSKGLHALRAWKEYGGFSWIRTLKSQLLRPILLPLWSDYKHLIHFVTQRDLKYTFPKKDFIRRMLLKEIALDKIQARRLDPLKEMMSLIVHSGTRMGQFWPLMSSYYTIDIRDPTADVHLVEYCLGVPNELNNWGGGKRMLIRRAMNGVLPDTVRWNTVRGKQASDAVFRLINKQDEISEDLARLESSSMVTRYLDFVAMKRAWRAIKTGNTPSMMTESLLRTINFAFFLFSLPEYQKQNFKTGE